MCEQPARNFDLFYWAYVNTPYAGDALKVIAAATVSPDLGHAREQHGLESNLLYSSSGNQRSYQRALSVSFTRCAIWSKGSVEAL